MCIKKSHSLFSLEQCAMKAGAGGARLSLASHLKFSGDRITIGADTDPRVVPGVWDPPDISGSCPWRREPPMGAWGWGSPSSAATGIHPTSAQSKTARGIYNFSSWFLSLFFPYHLNFGRVFDSFYLLSHHSSSCMGAAPDWIPEQAWATII